MRARLRGAVANSAAVGSVLWLATQGYLATSRRPKTPVLSALSSLATSSSASTTPFTWTHASATGNVLVVYAGRNNAGGAFPLPSCTVGTAVARRIVAAGLNGVGRNHISVFLANKNTFVPPAGSIGNQTVSIVPGSSERDPLGWAMDVSDPCGVRSVVSSVLNAAATSISLDIFARRLSLLLGAAIWGTGQAQAFTLGNGWSALSTIRTGTGTTGGDVNGVTGSLTAPGGISTWAATAEGSGANDDDRAAAAVELLPY